MATVSSSLALFDSMSGPLKAVLDSVNLTNSAMAQLANTANRDIKLDAALETAQKKAQEANVEFIEITKTLDGMRSKQDDFNASLNNANTQSSGLLSKIKAIGAAYLGWQTAKGIGRMSIGGAMEQQKMADMFIARTGDADIGRTMFEKFKSEALRAGQDVNKSLQSTLSFFSATQNADQLSKLNNLAQRMSAFDSAGNGIEGAAFALKEAMSGDIVSLAERFNMSKADIRAFKIDQLGKRGDMDGFIKAFDQLLEKQRMGQEAFDEMMKSPVKQFEIFKNNIVSKLADAGRGAMTALMPLIVLVNNAFQSGKFDPFFNALNIGLSLVARGLSLVVQGALWLTNVIKQYWPSISAMLIAWGATYIPALIIKLWGMVPPIVAQAVAWLAANWPILLVVAAIGLVIGILQACGVTAEQVIGFIGGIFGVLYSFIYNKVAALWNTFAIFASFLANLFIDPVYAVKKLFYDLAQNSLGYIKSMINGLETLINLIPGVKLDFTNKLDNYMKSLEKPTSKKNVVDIPKMQYMSAAEGANLGYSLGAKLGAGIKNGMANIGDKLKGIGDLANSANLANFGDPSKPKNIDTVKKVKKVDGKVDISSEDLKVMRDLAEMKNIQNFVTLTPTVAVTTGDINNNNGEDFDSLVRKLTNTLNEQIVSTAEGVYA